MEIKIPFNRSRQIFKLDKYSTEMLELANKAYGTKTIELILAALSTVFSDWTGEQQTLINIETELRNNALLTADVSRTIGCFSSFYPFVLKHDCNIENKIIDVKDDLRKISSSELAYGLSVKLHPEISFKYAGKTVKNMRQGIFKTIRFDHDKEQYPVYIVGDITDDRLTMAVMYSTEDFQDATIAGLLAAFEQALLEIIQHCQKKEDLCITLSDLTSEDITYDELESYQAQLTDIDKIYSLSPMQEGILYHTLLEAHDTYNIVSSIELKGSLDIAVLEQAFNQVVSRHEILRTQFDYTSFGKNMQIVYKHKKASIQYIDYEHHQEKFPSAILQQQKDERYHLSTDHLIGITVVKTAANEYTVIFKAHHILMDGWCIGIIVSELFKLYNGLKHGYTSKLEEPAQFSDYIAWLKTKNINEARNYWKNYLCHYDAAPRLPDPMVISNKQNRRERKWALDDRRTKVIVQLARRHKVTLNSLLQSIWAVILRKYEAKEDIVYGYVTSGRNAQLAKADRMVGLFINTLPLRVQFSDGVIFTELMQTMHKQIQSNSKYDYISLADIQKASSLKSDFMNSLFVFENYPLDLDELIEEIQIKNDLQLADNNNKLFRDEVIEETNYDLTLVATPGKQLEIKFLYNGFVWNEEAIIKLSNDFELVVDQIVNDESFRIGTMDWVDSVQKNKILIDFNKSSTDYPCHQTVAESFEEQAEKTPGQTAVVFQEQSLTYKDLNEKANQVAHALVNQGINKNKVVGILFERSLEMIISAIAILKAGGAYLMLDPDYPEERTKQMLSESNAALVITNEQYQSKVTIERIQCLLFPSVNKNARKGWIQNPERRSDPDSLAYIVYTSGTTGKPKGVMVQQKNIVRLVKNTNYLHLGSKDRLLQTGALTFDATTFEFWAPLLNGAALYLAHPHTILDAESLEQFLSDHDITAMFLTTALFHRLCEIKPSLFQTLQVLLFGGETVYPKVINLVRKHAPQLTLINLYGPAENSTLSTFYHVTDFLDETQRVPIGKPISNTQAYILDPSCKIVAIGAEGELCLSGEGLAAGYYNNELLTNLNFVDNPYLEGRKMYRTGDRARWLPDGNIEFLGRIDQQIKIRGFRIEPAEVEYALLKIEGINEATVITREDMGDKYLCAYYSSVIKYTGEELRNKLKQHVPDHMIPAWLIPLEHLPLTANGKIDKKQLPLPNRQSDTAMHFEAPQNETETAIASVWGKVLGLAKVGRNESFFELGGDSIKAIQVVSRLRSAGHVFELKDFSENPTIQILAQKTKAVLLQAEQAEVKGEVILTPIQAWFLEQRELDKNHFNQDLVLFSKEGFREEWIKPAIEMLIAHHDMLRTTYQDGVQMIGSIAENSYYELKVHDLQGKQDWKAEIVALSSQMQASMDITTGPLVKLGLFKAGNGDYLVLIIHHLVVDTVSWRILVEDFDMLYSGLKSDRKVTLPAKTTSFKDWAILQKGFAASHMMKKELEFWSNYDFSGVKPLQRVTDHPHQNGGNQLNIQTVILNKSYTQQLLTQTHQAYSTNMNDILLSALTRTMGAFNRAEKILFNLEYHGREFLLETADVTRTVGWFTSQYPAVLQCTNNLEELIIHTKDTLNRIPNKGIGYGLLKYLSPYPLSNHLSPAISFNYLGDFDSSTSGENFTISDVSAGKSVSKTNKKLYLLEFVCYVIKGAFHFTVSYSHEDFDDVTIAELLKSYMVRLEEIISHCLAQPQTKITASDLTSEKISMQMLKPYHNVLDKVTGIYRLTPMQEGLLFHTMSDHGDAYHVKMTVKLTGNLDLDLLNKSFQHLIMRHDILRTSFDNSHFHENMQIVYRERISQVGYKDLRNLETDHQQVIHTLFETDRQQGFDLEKDNLLRLIAVRTDEDQYSLILSHHHIILDGWSLGILCRELFQIYRSYQLNINDSLAEPPSYHTYLEWLNQQDQEKAIGYWSQYLSGYENRVDIPFKKKRTDQGRAQELIWNLGKSKTDAVEKLARDNNVTVNTILQSIWAIQLQRYHNIQDVVFGFIVSGRPAQLNNVEDMVGLFVNTIPLRVDTSTEKRYLKIIEKIKMDFDSNEPYRYTSISELQKLTTVQSGLINTLMVFENYPMDENYINDSLLHDIGLAIGDSWTQESTHYDFNLKVMSGKELTLTFDYNDGVYAYEDVERMKTHFEVLLNQILAHPDVRIDELELLSAEEQKAALELHNNAESYIHNQTTIQDLFEHNAAKYPDKAAIVYDDRAMTYSELNAKANSVAKSLRALGVGAEVIVPVMVNRSFEMIVGILAILKAGAAYLPIDPEYPADRINYMLRNSEAQLLVTTNETLQHRRFDVQHIIDITSEQQRTDVDNLDHSSNANSLAYVIYTSGTTDNPKGVMLEQKGIINLVHWFQHELGIGNDEKILQFASVAFDAFSWEWSMALLLGNTFYIPSKDTIMNPDLLNHYIEDNEITVLTIPPFVAGELAVENQLKKVIVAGSEVKSSQIEHLLGKVEVINAYGPTEDTICTMCYRITAKYEPVIPIGQPISNHAVCILDHAHKLVPDRGYGELCISGIGLARGYLNNEGLTNEKFIAHPYLAGERLYKTGDLVRRLADGQMEYAGRIDFQVKIRGFRIETQEIEKNMLMLPALSKAVVVDKQLGDDKYLCAYFVADTELDVKELRGFLAERLPKYMLPSYFIQLNSVPFNVNGKVDRKQLPDPETGMLSNALPEESLTKAEQEILHVCKVVLSLEHMSMHDSLSELGADSLRIVKIYKEFKKLKLNVSIKDLFYYDNLAAVYAHCIKAPFIPVKGRVASTVDSPATFSDIKSHLLAQCEEFQNKTLHSPIVKSYPASSIQHITIETNKTYSGAIMEFNKAVNTDVLKKSINAVIHTQGLLRSALVTRSNQISIEEHAVADPLDIPYVDLENSSEQLTQETISFIINELYRENSGAHQQLFNRLLYNIILVRITNTHYKLYMPFNHLIFDGMSMEIIKSEIYRAYFNQGELKENTAAGYDGYVNQINLGPQKVTEQQLMQKFDLDSFRECVRQYVQLLHNKEIRNEKISIGLTGNLYSLIKEHAWLVTMNIFRKILEINVELDKYPFVLLHPARKYKPNNYYNTIGEFIDLIPVVIEKGQNLELSQVSQRIQFAGEANVNFATLLKNKQIQTRYPMVSASLEGMYKEAILVPIFNYMELYDSRNEYQELEAGRREALNHSETLSTEVIVMLDKGQLTIELFCEHGKLKLMTDELEQYIYSLGNLEAGFEEEEMS